MEESRGNFQFYKDAKKKIYRWVQTWICSDVDEVPPTQGPADVADIVSILRDGLGFKVRHVDQSKEASEPDKSGCHVVVRCGASGLRVILELQSEQCHCCIENTADVHIWNVSSSTERLHEVGSTALTEVNSGVSRVVRETIDKLRQVLVEMKDLKVNNRWSVESLPSLRVTPSPNELRRTGSTSALSGDKLNTSFRSIQDYSFSSRISPVPAASSTTDVPSFGMQEKLEKLNIKSDEPTDLLQSVEIIKKHLVNIENIVRSSNSVVGGKNSSNPSSTVSTLTVSTSTPKKMSPGGTNLLPVSTELASKTTRKIQKETPVFAQLMAAKRLFSDKSKPTPRKTTAASEEVAVRKLQVASRGLHKQPAVSHPSSIKKPISCRKSKSQLPKATPSQQRVVIPAKRKLGLQNNNGAENPSKNQELQESGKK